MFKINGRNFSVIQSELDQCVAEGIFPIQYPLTESIPAATTLTYHLRKAGFVTVEDDGTSNIPVIKPFTVKITELYNIFDQEVDTTDIFHTFAVGDNLKMFDVFLELKEKCTQATVASLS